MILKYGKEEGERRYSSYVAKQKYHMSKQYYIDKYGIEIGPVKYQEFKDKTKFMTSEKQYINI